MPLLISFRKKGEGMKVYLRYDDGEVTKTISKSKILIGKFAISHAKQWSANFMESDFKYTHPKIVKRTFDENMECFFKGNVK